MRLAAVAGVATLGSVAACSTDAGPVRDPAGVVIEAGTLSVFELQEGDCFDNPDEASVSTVGVVPCEVPHQLEVVGLALLAGDPVSGGSEDDESRYPGRVAVDTLALEACEPLFEDYVGQPSERSALTLHAFPPSDDSWNDGDRTAVCLGFEPGLGPIEGSVQDRDR